MFSVCTRPQAATNEKDGQMATNEQSGSVRTEIHDSCQNSTSSLIHKNRFSVTTIFSNYKLEGVLAQINVAS